MNTHMRALARRYGLLGCGFRRHGLARRQSGAIAVKKVDQVVDDTPGFSKHGIFTDFLNVGCVAGLYIGMGVNCGQ